MRVSYASILIAMTNHRSCKPGFRLRASPGPSEYDEQCALARWLDYKGYNWLHCPNGEKRDARTGARLKKAGVKPGVPDVLIFTPPPNKEWAQSGVAIEMKTAQGGKLSREQSAWLDALAMIGWHVRCCHGAKDAIGWLQTLGY